MAFSARFPRKSDKSVYPKWEEVFLSEEEEKEIEETARQENIELLKECIEDAKEIIQEKELKEYDNSIIKLAISLFEKRASHEVYFKERKAKEKFDKI